MTVSTRVILDPKRTADLKPYQFDFTSLLQVGESVSSAGFVITVWSGVDASPSAILSGSATITNGVVVNQNFTGGVLGCIYTVMCQATTNNSHTLTLVGMLAIIPVGI